MCNFSVRRSLKRVFESTTVLWGNYPKCVNVYFKNYKLYSYRLKYVVITMFVKNFKLFAPEVFVTVLATPEFDKHRGPIRIDCGQHAPGV